MFYLILNFDVDFVYFVNIFSNEIKQVINTVRLILEPATEYRSPVFLLFIDLIMPLIGSTVI